MHAWQSVLAGIVVVVAVWILFALLLKDAAWPAHAFNGSDNRPSTSKFQFFFWTVLVVWAYVAVAARQWFDHQLGTAAINVPANVLAVMGISAGTAVGAKLIAVSSRTKTTSLATAPYSSLFTDDNGNIALEKVQFIAWTLVAGGIFVLLVRSALLAVATPTGLPDIDATLLALTGISSGSYLTAKGVATYGANRSPAASAAAPAAGAAAPPPVGAPPGPAGPTPAAPPPPPQAPAPSSGPAPSDSL